MSELATSTLETIDLNKLSAYSDDVRRSTWFNLKLSISGDAGTGKSTFALEEAAYIASMFPDITVPLYVVDTDDAIMSNLTDKIVREKLIKAGVDLKIINTTKILHSHKNLMEGYIKLLDTLYELRDEVTKAETPVIMIMDSLTDLRTNAAIAMTQARYEKESKDPTKKISKTSTTGNVADMLKDTSTQGLDWMKVKSIMIDLTSIAKNSNIHAIFTSKEKYEKIENKMIPKLDGYAGIAYDCAVNMRIYKEEDIVNGESKMTRKIEIKKFRLGRETAEEIYVIPGNFDDYMQFVEEKLKVQYA
ncbi:RecA/RadA recombinase [Methanococcus maripaludis]|uniref:RecA/RadA recombinase n=1 Tax=Methanococcus maripaludis TaxID=39152 RepID=A0A7J9NVJ8_METMI|nr:hypothetical protein [Methanococcus maripaludis]MBA2851698.1 RecA/RadA recombinase [Methanococcus maripaludis]